VWYLSVTLPPICVVASLLLHVYSCSLDPGEAVMHAQLPGAGPPQYNVIHGSGHCGACNRCNARFSHPPRC
jgi:hypothetical protein